VATMREQILDAVVAAFNAARPVGVPMAERKRLKVAELDALPLIDVATLEESKEPIGGRTGPTVRRRLRIVLRFWVAGDAPEVTADPMVAHATAALEGNRLGGLTLDGLEELAIRWTDEVGEFTYGVAEMEFLAEYMTKRQDQEVKA